MIVILPHIWNSNPPSYDPVEKHMPYANQSYEPTDIPTQLSDEVVSPETSG